MKENEVLRKELLNLLSGKNAHATFEKAVANFPMEHLNSKIEGIDHSSWQLLEHMRLAQWDILDFIRNPNYKTMEFPADYWPKEEKVTPEMWEETVEKFKNDYEEFVKIVNDPATDFFTPIPHAKDYTIFREMLVVADHNSYHAGQLVLMRKILGIW